MKTVVGSGGVVITKRGNWLSLSGKEKVNSNNYVKSFIPHLQ